MALSNFDFGFANTPFVTNVDYRIKANKLPVHKHYQFLQCTPSIYILIIDHITALNSKKFIQSIQHFIHWPVKLLRAPLDCKIAFYHGAQETLRLKNKQQKTEDYSGTTSIDIAS